MPVLSTLMGWNMASKAVQGRSLFCDDETNHGFEMGNAKSRHAARSEFGPIRVRAFGTYALQATDPKALLNEIVGVDDNFQSEEITDLLRSMIISAFSQADW